MVNILEENKSIVDENVEQLSLKIKTIHDYIDLKQYLDSEKAQDLTDKV